MVTFSTPGTYSVKLVVQNATGIAEIERINYITVFPSPTASFSADLTLGCVPSTINFTDLSFPTGTIASWEWDFGDGGTSTQQNPSHTYTGVGFFNVTLTVTSSTGCKNTISAGSYIRIVGGVTTDFSFSPPPTCRAPFVVNFQNQSNGPGTISYAWDFGNGQTSTAQNPSTIYNAPGTYTVSLNTQSDLGCTGSIQKTITISETTTDFSVPTNICLNQPVTFQNVSSSPPVSSAWNFGDGTSTSQINPSKTYLIAGNYSVQLINQYANCIDSITKPVVVTDKPVVNFTAPDTANCQAPFTVQFTDFTIGATSWQWDFGDGGTSTLQNPSHQYTTTGDFNVSLTVTTATGCSNTLVKSPYVLIHPTTIELNLPTGGCIPFQYTPIATIQTLDPIVSYAWDLGVPGATFNVANPPPFTYTAAGAYDVTLTVTTASGCIITHTEPGGVRTGIPPVVDFTFAPTSACASDTISFTDLTIFAGALHEWLWDFGDGTTSNEQNPQHVFEDTGVLTVKLTAFNDRCTAFITKVINIRPPIALFDHVVDCATGTVTFTDRSIVDIGLAPLSYAWDFGNGQTSILPNPGPVTYALPGTYTVTLIVTNGGCSYTRKHDIIITTEPATFSINRNPVCKNEVFTLTATGSNAANISSYKWVVGIDTLPATTRSVTHSIANVGAYDITLILVDINGCTSINKMPGFLNVNGPAANFTVTAPGACLNKPITFTDLSTPVGTIRTWDFDFGDGSQQSFAAPPFTHIYTELGGHFISLTVTDNAGCKDTYTSPNVLLATNPIAGFRADTFYCPRAPLQFVDTSSGVGLTYAWSFGDGNTSAIQNPQNTYPLGDASYTIKLKITDISGCMDSVTKVNYIKIRSPKAAFDIRDTATICPPLRTSFTFQGTDYQSFFWAFGDGATSTALNPGHFYGNFGHFIPTLYLIGPGGCMDSAKASVSVYDPASSQINYGPITTACNSLNVDFNLVVPPGFKFNFSFGDGAVDTSGRTSFSHFYSRPSLSYPLLFLIDTLQGCQSVISGNPRIDVLGAIPLFGKDKKEFCDQGLVTFKDFTTKNEPIISNVWDFGDGTTSNATDPSHNYTQPGTYVVSLNVTTQSNCSSVYKDTIYVYRTPAPSIISRDTICVNVAEPINGLLTQVDTVTNWQWNFGNGQTSTQQNNTITYTTPGEYTLQLTTTNKIGCSSVITKKVFVSPPPSAVPVQEPITIISGGSASLAMTYTGNIVSYNWLPTTKLSCTDCPVPVANPQFTTKYNVQVQDNNGCRSSADINVIVVCNKQNFFVPNTFSPNGDGQNEVFFPRGTGLFSIKSMTIFNRWGQIIFERKNLAVNDPTAGWNGTFNGQKASADVYVYMMEILCDNGFVIPVKGNVTLLR